MAAPTLSMAGSALQYTFTTQSSTLSDYIPVPAEYSDGPTGALHNGTQFAKVECDFSIGAATATLEFVLTDGTTVFDSETVALAAGTRRTLGTLGNYIGTAVGARSGTNKIDLFGANGTASPKQGDRYWAYSATLISSGSVVVRVLPGKAI